MIDLYDAARATRGTAFGANVLFSGVSTDSRGIGAGELFVALAGERFDGHEFLAQARQRGAVAAMVNADRAEALAGLGMPLLAVADTRHGLGRLASDWRRQFALPLIAVTGSNGKTTTKEMIASILRAQTVLDGYDPDIGVLATRGNLNNDIGLPLTLLKLRSTHRSGIVELGMNRPGEIAYLAGIAAASVGVVTNAQRAHLAGMGSLDEVAREKGALLAHLAATGTAVINADETYAPLWRELAGRRRVLSFSLGGAADVVGEDRAAGLATALSITLPQGRIEVPLRLPGRHNARNAVAAAATAWAAGISAAAIQAGLAAFRGVKGRLQARAALAGATLLDDTYNANPDSVRAGIDVLAALSGQRLLVLGDMGEIGEEAPRFHAEVGAYAKARGIDRLFTFGEASALAAQEFGAGAEAHPTLEALIEAVRAQLSPTTTVLVKGSRFMRMERVADALASEGGKA